MRERQHLGPFEVQITVLTPDLALTTGQEKFEMWLKGGKYIKGKHTSTIIWKKEQDGWKIIHSHESWAEEQAD